MTFEELVAEVITKTNRPDMGFVEDGGDGRIPAAVRNATLTMHNKDFFFRDIQPAEVVFDTSAYLQLLDTTTLPRYRNIAYARKWDPSYLASQSDPTILPPLFDTAVGIVSSDDALAFFKPLSPTNILDGYGVEKLNVMYQAGDTIYLKSSTSFLYALFGWYAFPSVTNISVGGVITKAAAALNYKSWIADKFPNCIWKSAASEVFTTIGQQDTSRKMDAPGGEVAEATEALMKSNVTMAGY